MKMRKKRSGIIALAAVAALFLSGLAIAAGGTIDINTASVEELATLKRVGQAYAERIVAYREANGPFKNPQDIMNVKGIGQKTYDANMDVIVVSKPKKK